MVKPGWVDQLMDGIDHVKYLRPGTTLMAVAAHNNFQFSKILGCRDPGCKHEYLDIP